ncbi:MAG: diheme cytochrome c-553 [Candidatus Pseudobacter hemicellulosilyticus]|uniref:Diheme cytochrome c-553 n=1 Tax=Candidatus Pseudobacter hemicellulosilyticus TaxID=3121375 RepID=A0AAJ5X192_9BACT|nr:MAG: diheme cytochrome c-553 [Pseudobacter sp.]
MKRKVPVIIAAIILAGYVISACGSSAPAQPASLQSSDTVTESPIARGQYLVTVIGCGDCHSPKVMTPMGPAPDTGRALSGHPADMPLGAIDKKALGSWVLFNHMTTAVVGPWGVSFAANLTSDTTGIGTWSEKQFFTAMRKGKFKGLEGGRPLLPPMPWQNYGGMSDEDLRAIFAYLKSTKPIKNVVPAPKSPAEL